MLDEVLKTRLGGFREVLRIELQFGLQRLEPPCQAGFIATGVGRIVLPGRLELPADRRASFIDTAPHAAADITQKRNTARSRASGTDHHQSKIIQLFGHLQRDPAGGIAFGFAPVKGCTVKGATCATTQTRIDNHLFHLFRFQSA